VIGRFAFVSLLALIAGTALAHPLAPALLELTESDGGRVEVRWKTSLWRPTGSALEPVLPASCTGLTDRVGEDDDTGRTERWTLHCTAPLVGATIGVDGLATTSTNAIVRVRLQDGRVLQTVLADDSARYIVPERPAAGEVLRSYAGLGVGHILQGFDHLLFVFGLLLLAGSGRRLIGTVTAFTLGHSVTLALATLGVAALPSGPVELLIAATILWLAVELASDPRRRSWARRRPWLMASGFGLLHGLGFAGALREVGLPEGEIPLALFAFNVGIEAGQLLFVATVLALAAALRPLRLRLPAAATAVPVYVMGTLAAYWCFERAAMLW
jgi:hydrogenase/urease accessory protein HupE